LSTRTFDVTTVVVFAELVGYDGRNVVEPSRPTSCRLSR